MSGLWRLLIAVALSCSATVTAFAQATPNAGALTFTGGIDVPSLYIYRGIVQEGDPKLTLTPFGDIGVRLGAARVNIGLWNSLNTGTSGSGGPLKSTHYSEQFYATLTFNLTKRLTLTPGYLANTSPNRGYNTIKEFNLRLAASGRIAPYGLIAVELDDEGQADGGSKKGTYLELGAAPTLAAVGRLKLTLPVKAGFSLSNYYELFANDLTYQDHRFGYVALGGVLTVSLSSPTSRFGAWNAHGGADVLSFGDTTRAFNLGNQTKVVISGGVGVTY